MMMAELAAWDGFYMIAGSAAGALIGLQFVVITLIGEKPPVDAERAGAAFATPTIVHFGAVLLLAALMHVPWPAISVMAGVVGLMGGGGVGYAVFIALRMRAQAAYRPVFEDWLFHVVAPLTGYAGLAAACFAAAFHPAEALLGIGAAALVLLFTGIHNAWDAAAYHVWVLKRRE